ncbi:MAG: hypothetical protein KGL90_10540 [Burkholderiales bacterium]|nr:hypothetical protein [Burkholderiales bacterium]
MRRTTHCPTLLSVRFAATVAGVLTLATAQAQMVPLPEHVMRTIAIPAQGTGLNVADQSFWPHWEGRIGLVLDRPVNPLKDSYVLTQPSPNNGLTLRSAHILSDYYFSGGFRATAGLVRGSVTRSIWGDSVGTSGLNLSLQRLDTLSLYQGNNAESFDGENRTLPYVGAGYTASLATAGNVSMWRFNADLGIITVNSNNIDRISRVLQGDASVTELVRDLRLRPVVKVSVRYAF